MLLRDLPNIGPVVEQQLFAAGIKTEEDLKRTGSREAWLRILAADSSACIHRLYALEGAIRGIPAKALANDIREALKDFYRRAKNG